MHVHLIGVAGTGMGALAGLLQQAGHRVTGSDTAFYPPMGDALRALGIETKEGFRAENLAPRPDLVVVGNVIRKENPEARAAIDGGMTYTSMPGAIEELFLKTRPAFVVCGTHGKTTTSTLLAFLLHSAGTSPGFLVGGVPQDFGESFRVGSLGAPFVLEGDEYDSAFFEKQPKFFRYKPRFVILTSIEHDHVDIYPTMDSYRAAYDGLAERIPEQGLLVAWAGDPEVRAIAKKAKCRVSFYALDGDDCGDVTPVWSAGLVGAGAPGVGEGQAFDLFFGGSFAGRVLCPMAGAHNARNAIAAIALATEGAGVALQSVTRSLQHFHGVKRRQELRGTAAGVRVYDDFAHHPTAVRETVAAIRARHPAGKLIALFEPRSATASRKTHEVEYPDAFALADVSILAPVGRPEIPKEQKLDVDVITAAIREKGKDAHAPADLDGVVRTALDAAKDGDTILVMSNGAFGGVHEKLLDGLRARA